MSKTKIYLAGAMTAFNDKPDLALEWRCDIEDALEDEYNVINPAVKFWLEDDPDEKAAFEWDLYSVRTSDIIIVNFSNCATSLGTQHELAIAYEMKKPIIGLNTTNEKLHPWQEIVCQKIFSDKEDLLMYIREHY